MAALEDQVKALKEEIATLRRQKDILRDAAEFASDAAAGIMLSLKADQKIEAVKKAELLQQTALTAMTNSLL
jgi:hypothetical protein